MREDWRAVGAKRTLWRRIRDRFDDTVMPSRRKKNNLFLKAKKIEDYCAPPVIIYEPEVLPPGNLVLAPPVEEEIRDLIIPTKIVTVPVPRIQVEKKEIFIPIKTIGFTLSRSKKVIDIKLPKIKIKLVQLKRLMYITGSVAMIGILFFVAITAKRVIDLTDGDYLNTLIRYKMGEEIDARVNPVAARVDGLKNTVDTLEANQIPIVNYVVKRKVKKIQMVNGKITSVKEYEE